MKFEAILLDMDGLMFDTETYNDLAWAKACEQTGYSITEEILTLTRGVNSKKSKEIMLEHLGKDFPYDKIHSLVRTYWYGMLDEHVPHKEGLLNFLNSAKEKNYKIAVASSTKKEQVIKNLKKANVYDFIDIIACGDEVRNSKPAPDIFLLAAQRLGVSAQNCLVLEDSFNGVRAGHAAKCTVIMVPDKDQPDETISALPYKIEKNLNEVIQYL